MVGNEGSLMRMCGIEGNEGSLTSSMCMGTVWYVAWTWSNKWGVGRMDHGAVYAERTFEMR